MNELKYKTTTSCFICLFTSSICFSISFTLKVFNIKTQPHPNTQPPLTEEFNLRAPSDYTADATYSTTSSINTDIFM